jgi:hypothetical protein
MIQTKTKPRAAGMKIYRNHPGSDLPDFPNNGISDIKLMNAIVMNPRETNLLVET